ncbi:MAG: hypothetical protein DRP50_00200 [Thermotoga sp.]|nr:MAG: hypothetical protein DRP50_00200 [Thermotoga sp.]
MKLIDVHAHLYLVEGRGEEDKWRLEFSKKYGISVIIVSVLGSWGKRTPTYFPDPEDFSSGNRKLWKFIKSHEASPKIYGYAAVNQIFTREAIEEIKKGIEVYGFVGVKLVAPVPCSDLSTFPIVEKAIEYNVPILIHTFHKKPQKLWGQNPSDSSDIAKLAEMYPEAKIIMAHIGGGGDWEYALKAIKDNDNAFLDTSGSGCDRGMIEKAVRIVGENRILFATDLNITTGIAKFSEARLSDAQREKIAWGNAKSIFGGVEF